MTNDKNNGSEESPEAVRDLLKAQAMNECNDWVVRCKRLMGKCEESGLNGLDDLSEARMAFNEARITWLERACGVMDVDVRRAVINGHLDLFWADHEGEIMRDEEGVPLQEIEGVADIVALTVPADKALKVISGETDDKEAGA